MSEPLFDKSSEYDEMLAAGLKLSGEPKEYFIKCRIQDLKENLPKDFQPKRILDYGCGLGETSFHLSQLFPRAQIVGVDTAFSALTHARSKFQTPLISFAPVENIAHYAPYDLCYTNGVFHHIEPKNRTPVIRQIFESLVPGGFFSLFENNPWNPGTHLVMSRIAFDRNAKTLSHKKTRTLLQDAGFICARSRFLFYFPRILSGLRFLEPLGASIPLGAQYYVLGTRPRSQ